MEVKPSELVEQIQAIIKTFYAPVLDDISRRLDEDRRLIKGLQKRLDGDKVGDCLKWPAGAYVASVEYLDRDSRALGREYLFR